MNARHGRWSGGAGYTWLDATFESPETVNGIGNSTNDAAAAGGKGLHGTIAIRPGDRIPLIPRHMLKAFADCQVTTRLSLDVDIVAASGVFARGNENNASQPDGTYYLGPGATPAYGDCQSRRALPAHASACRSWRRSTTCFDHRYYTAAQLGPTGFTAAGQYIARALPASQGQFPVPQSHLLCARRAGGLLGGDASQVLKPALTATSPARCSTAECPSTASPPEAL